MSDSKYSPTVVWGPGYIGFVIATLLYGVEICQFAFYFQAFPSDTVIMKLQVYTVAALDTAHFFILVIVFYNLLVICRVDISPTCYHYVPSIGIVAISLVYLITFMVQVFYAHRVWIVSNRNLFITLAVLVTTLLQLVLGMAVVVGVIRTPTNAFLYSTKFSPLASVASAVCDAIIMLSVVYYLRPVSIRRGNLIEKLVVVFVQMGLLTFINSLAMVILYFIQDHTLGQFLTTAPAVILSKSYVNSMLAVLNARKPIRDEQQNLWGRSMEIPTIPTLY